MDKSRLIGVVTVTYNSEVVIPAFVAAILSQSYTSFILYVVDNASSDRTLILLDNYSDTRIVIINNSDNLGVAEGNNIGIRAALLEGCAAVLLINNDTTFGTDLLASLVAGLDTYYSEMIVPKILYFSPSDRIWCAGGAFSRLRGLSRHFGFNQKDDGRFDKPRMVSYSPTCCMLIKREVFARIGLMDAKYFVYFDDTDFCWRAYRNGIRLFYCPNATIYHKVSSLIGHQSGTALRYLSRNHVYYVMKNFKRWTLLYYLPICQVQVLWRCVIAKNKVRALAVAEKSFWEGIGLFRAESDHAGRSVISGVHALHPTTEGKLRVPGTEPDS